MEDESDEKDTGEGDGDDNDDSSINAFADLCYVSFLEASLHHLGVIFGEVLEPCWGPLGAFLEASETLFGQSWRISTKEGGAYFSVFPLGPKNRLRGQSWGPKNFGGL